MKPLFTLTFLLAFIAYTNGYAQCSYFTKIVTGSTSVHTLGIKSDGTLWAWGANDQGELGNGTTTESLVPVQVGKATNWIDIATGTSFSLGITADHKLWGWGNNGVGQYGNGTAALSNVPVELKVIDSNWVYIAACESHSLAISADGKLWATGYGILGVASGNTSNTFIQIGIDSDWASISTGNYHTLALKKDGTLWAWGRNAEGELGDGDTADPSNIYIPEKIGKAKWLKVAAGSDHSMGIKFDSTLWTWGQNGDGELGNGTTTNGTHGPAQVGKLHWAAIAGGYAHSLGITTSGQLWGWGENLISELGDGTAHDTLSPERIGTLSNWKSVSGGEQFSVGLTAEKYSWTWGRNDEGEIGNNTNHVQLVPLNVGAGPFYSGLATTGAKTIVYQDAANDYAVNCAALIATVNQYSTAPINGYTTAKVWIDASVQADENKKPYVQRHYEISPFNYANISTGTVTLYFTQNEFAAYNKSGNVINGTFPLLPIDSTDAEGYRANLRMTVIDSVSRNGSGALTSYGGTRTLIKPTSITYKNGKWQVTFNTLGFGGFFAATGLTILPVTWVNVTATLNGKSQAQINWQVQEENVESYAVEKSIDSKTFSSVGVVASKGGGVNSYQFTEPQTLNATAYYRIKQTDKDGQFRYSVVMQLNPPAGLQILALYPNPVNDHVFITGLLQNETYTATVTDLLGRTVFAKQLTGGQNEILTNTLGSGVYLVKITGQGATTTLKLVKQ